MPDTIIETKGDEAGSGTRQTTNRRGAAKRTSVDNGTSWQPTAFVNAIVVAALPAVDKEGSPKSLADLARALYPHFGGYTVADAVLMLGMIRTRTAGGCVHGFDREFGALCSIATLLEDFAAHGNASGPECAAARATLLELATQDDAWDLGDSAKIAATRMLNDVSDLRGGHFTLGSRFDEGPGCVGRWWLQDVVMRCEGVEAAEALMNEREAV